MPQGNLAQGLDRMIDRHARYQSMASSHSADGLFYITLSGAAVYMGGDMLVNAFHRSPTEILLTAAYTAAVTALGLGILGRGARAHFKAAARAETQAERLEGQAYAARLVKEKWGLNQA